MWIKILQNKSQSIIKYTLFTTTEISDQLILGTLTIYS